MRTIVDHDTILFEKEIDVGVKLCFASLAKHHQDTFTAVHETPEGIKLFPNNEPALLDIKLGTSADVNLALGPMNTTTEASSSLSAEMASFSLANDNDKGKCCRVQKAIRCQFPLATKLPLKLLESRA